MQYLSAVLPLFSAVLFLCLGISVFFLAKGKLKWIFFKFCYIIFHWQFSWFVLFSLNNSSYSDLICRIGYSGIIFLPITFYETVVYYLNLPRKYLAWFYYPSFGFLASLWTTNLFIKGPYLQGFGYYPEAGPLHLAYLAMVCFLMAHILFSLYRVFKKETDLLRKTQVKFFFVSSIVFCFSAVDYLLNYPAFAGEFNNRIYPFGVFFISWSMLIFVLSHFIRLSLTLEKRVALKTEQLKTTIDALEESARARKDFIANITHELRTPLTLIRGWICVILERDVGGLSEKLVETMDKIGLQTLILTKKINELLKISLFDAGMAKLVLTKTDVDAGICETVSSFKGLAEQRGICLTYAGDPGVGEVFVDQEKLKDILNNLIRNAYKFTEKGQISVALVKKEGRMIITVKDTGIGMSGDLLQSIFKRFQQGDSSTTRKYEGSGLGLAIVKESVEMMKGSISVKSSVGKGSVFTIDLPMDLEKRESGSVLDRRGSDRRAWSGEYRDDDRRQKDRRLTDLARIGSDDLARICASDTNASSQETVRKIETDNSRGVILIAEDNTAIQEFLATALERYTLFISSNGQAAWQAIDEVKPDLVLSDIMMPIMDGYSLLEKIRTNAKTSTIPVIIITSLTEQDDRIKSLQLGADDYLTKPFHHLELQARVKNVLSLHKLEREKTRSEQLETFLMVLASAIESKDKYTGGHVERVAGYARDLARKAKLPEFQVNEIFMGSIVHDVGKIGIRDEVLNKSGRLTPEEFEHIKTHPEIGKRLLSQLEIAPVAVNIAYSHQEKWDGTGYPCGLCRQEIPIEARISTIADFWDAITSDRPYREAMPLEKAIAIMHDERGKSFDPELFDLFMDQQDQLYLRHLGQKEINSPA